MQLYTESLHSNKVRSIVQHERHSVKSSGNPIENCRGLSIGISRDVVMTAEKRQRISQRKSALIMGAGVITARSNIYVRADRLTSLDHV